MVNALSALVDLRSTRAHGSLLSQPFPFRISTAGRHAQVTPSQGTHIHTSTPGRVLCIAHDPSWSMSYACALKRPRVDICSIIVFKIFFNCEFVLLI